MTTDASAFPARGRAALVQVLAELEIKDELMTVYADWLRTDDSPQGAMEPQAGFLDRVAGSYWDQVRHVINEWCSHLPASSRPGLRSRLLDRNADANVYSALWELYLHEMLLGSGYSVEIEQQVGTRGRKPDFLVSRGDEQFVVEAIWTAERVGDPRHGKLATQLRDANREEYPES